MIYQNFNFDQWLAEYHLTYLFFSHKEPDVDLMESEFSNLEEMRELFYAQHHNENDDIWCGCCQYLNILTGFNELCAVISQKEWKTEDVVAHFLKKRYPSHKRSKSIAHALTKGIKSYISVDENGNEFEFQKYMVKNIEKFFTKLGVKQ